MWKKLNKLTKVLIVFLVLIVAILIAIPIIAKSYVNDNGKELLGRRVHLSSLGINYFSGSFSLGDLLVYEENEKDTFLYINEFYVNAGLMQCINQNYVIEDIEIDGLECHTIMTDSIFNFTSIIDFFSDTTEVVEEEPTEPVHYALENISLKNSLISFQDAVIGSHTVLNDFNISIPKGIRWDDSQLDIYSNFGFPEGGKVSTEFQYNLESGLYDVKLKSDSLHLEVIQPYLEDFMKVGSFTGSISADMEVKGGAEDAADIDVIGYLGLHDLSITDTLNTEVMGIKNLSIRIDSLNPAKDIYKLSAIEIDLPYVRYEMFKTTDNFTELFMLTDSTSEEAIAEEEHESNIFVMIKDYVVETLDGIKASNFSLDTLNLTNVKLLYKDHSLLKPFSYLVSETELVAHHVYSNADSLKVNLKGRLNNKGTFLGWGILHPQKPEDVTLHFSVNEFAMKDISPYFYEYVAFPITRGQFYMTCDISVKDKYLLSSNNLNLKSFNLGRKQKHDSAYNLPLKVAVAMLKDRQGDIPIDVPVEGNLADPKYKVWKTIGNIFKELILKAASSPYKLIAGGADEESSKRIVVEQVLDSLSTSDYNRLDKLAEILVEKPNLSLILDPYYNRVNEVNNLAAFYAKAEYVKLDKKISYTSGEMDKINSVKVKDSLFVSFIDSKLSGEMSTEEKISKLYQNSEIQQVVDDAIKNKVNFIYNYLKAKGVNDNQLPKEAIIYHNDSQNKKIIIELMFDVVE